jgi:hypothetical protein
MDARRHRVGHGAAKLRELRKVTPWEQGSFIEKGGWSAMPGNADRPSQSGVAQACASLLMSLK